MSIRLYFDEDTLRHSLVKALRSRGVDVITALDANMIEHSDAEHLAYASSQGRVLCRGLDQPERVTFDGAAGYGWA